MSLIKYVFLLLIVAPFANAFGQNKFYVFSINDKIGITDDTGSEIEAAVNAYYKTLPEKDEIILYNFSDKKDLIFNTLTKKKTYLESIIPADIVINGISYSKVKEKGKSYFLSTVDNKTIDYNDDFYFFNNVGNYIIAKYSVVKKTPAKSASGKAKGAILPEPPSRFDYEDGLAIFDPKTGAFTKPLVKGIFENYLPLYENKRENSNNGMAKVEIITINDIDDRQEPFDYLLLTNKSTHSLYDSSLKLIKKFEFRTDDKNLLAEKAGSFISKNLSWHNLKNAYPPSMPSTGRSVTKPEIIYPVNVIQNSDNISRFFIKKSATDSVLVLSTTLKIDWVSSTNEIHLEDKNGNDSHFFFDPVTAAIFLPKKYWAKLGIIK